MALACAHHSVSALVESPTYLSTPCAVLADPANLFNEWFETEELEWQRAHQLAESCPVQYVCPISLEIMSDPVTLVSGWPYTVKYCTTQPCPALKMKSVRARDRFRPGSAMSALTSASGSSWAATPAR